MQINHWFYEAEKGNATILSIIPFFHIFGLTVALNFPVFLAATIILAPSFELINILKLISKYKPTLFPGTPAMFSAISRHREIRKYNLTSIKFCISGSAPLTKKIQQDFIHVTGSKLVEGFGLTESSPVTHCNPFNGRDKEGSIGLPMPDTMCKIVDIEKGEKVLNIGEEGELCIKGPQVMKGYFKNELETLFEEYMLYGGYPKVSLAGSRDIPVTAWRSMSIFCRGAKPPPNPRWKSAWRPSPPLATPSAPIPLPNLTSWKPSTGPAWSIPA